VDGFAADTVLHQWRYFWALAYEVPGA
jgi:hypothetical protein